jgi:phospholipase C
MPSVPSERRAEAGSNGAAKISHVVIVVQENRSFNNLFQGYPGAETVASGPTKSGKVLTLKAVGLATRYDIDHSASAMFAACDGTGKLPGTSCKMDAFDQEQQLGGPENGQYVYVPHAESKPYFDMAHEWVLADHMFASQLDESFVSHQYIIAAQAQSSVDLPFLPEWGCEGGKRNFVETVLMDRSFGKPQRACFDYTTLGDELDHAKRSWRFYTSKVVDPADGVWSGYQAVRHIRYGPDWKKDVITPQKRFLHDIAGGTLADVTWITPTCEDSDHVNCGGGFGPSWVTAVVNAIGTSSFWDTTAIFVMWDDWGGLYDPVPPPYLDDDGLGFRVPLLVISPYAKKNYVSHVRYEHGSILKFAEDAFGLGRLAASDTRANSPAADCFDFSRPPRAFVPIHAPKGPAFFLQRADDLRPPDNQ